MKNFDVVIIGAGAAGLMCAMAAGHRGRAVLVIDHARKPGEKIRISGGGRCNFTNVLTSPSDFVSENPHFCRSALAGYTADDFVSFVKLYNISFHERDHGQLFCDDSAQQITDMLLAECAAGKVSFRFQCNIEGITKTEAGWQVQTSSGALSCASLVIASGGKSIPKIGASSFGFDFAMKQGLRVVTPRAALVPFVFSGDIKDRLAGLAGISLEAEIRCGKARFREALLFTHRGLSGPAVLQISTYWQDGQPIFIDLAPDVDVAAILREARHSRPKQDPLSIVCEFLPRRLAKMLVAQWSVAGNMAELSEQALNNLAGHLKGWKLVPGGTEGYRTAEVTLGGVDTRCLSQKTFECRTVPGLYFIGEVVDVTGHLGGFNFQWAWSSGYAAGQAV